MNGLCSSSTPSSSTPWRAMVSAVYPETKSTLACRPLEGQPLRQLAASHAGHDHVADDEVNGSAVRPRHVQGGQPVLRLQDPVPALLEDFAGEGAQGRLVLDEQHRRVSTWGRDGARSARGRACSDTDGRNTVNVEPPSRTDSTVMWPPVCLTMPYTVASPSPVPRPLSLVVKNGSKMWDRTSASMPQPVSFTESAT